jgi:hypothetical protein
MNKPHKYAALIKAWADGAEIEYKPFPDTTWQSFPHLSWNELNEYRIKPKTIKFRNALMSDGFQPYYVITYNSPSAIIENNPGFIKWLGDWQEVEI